MISVGIHDSEEAINRTQARIHVTLTATSADIVSVWRIAPIGR
jgi:hypothetical protein